MSKDNIIHFPTQTKYADIVELTAVSYFKEIRANLILRNDENNIIRVQFGKDITGLIK